MGRRTATTSARPPARRPDGRRADRALRPGTAGSRRRLGFTLVELCIGLAILLATAGVVVPTVVRLKAAAARTACAHNLRQVGAGLTAYRAASQGRLPARPSGLDQTNPHVFKYKDLPESIAPAMERAVGSRDVYYCPGNYQSRAPAQWWHFTSGTVAVTYQFPFLLKPSLWLVPRPNYAKPGPDAVLAADYLASDASPSAPLAWNHDRRGDAAPVGANALFADGRVEWRDGGGGWVLWGRSGGPMNWYLPR